MPIRPFGICPYALAERVEANAEVAIADPPV